MAKLASFVPIKVKSIKYPFSFRCFRDCLVRFRALNTESLKRTAACKETKYIQPSQLQNLQRKAKSEQLDFSNHANTLKSPHCVL